MTERRTRRFSGLRLVELGFSAFQLTRGHRTGVAPPAVLFHALESAVKRCCFWRTDDPERVLFWQGPSGMADQLFRSSAAGSTRVARRAGTTHASTATAMSNPAVPANIRGSVALVSYSED